MLDDLDTCVRSATTDADGRLLCWRCRCDIDADFFCSACGATSTPPSRRPRTLRQALELANAPAEIVEMFHSRPVTVTSVLTTETVPLVPIEFGTPRKAA